MNIWKLSHGSSHFSHENHENYLSQCKVSVHPKTGAKGVSSITQGENFTSNKRKYDIFYVCWGNNHIDLIGIFTEEVPYDDDEDWKYRNFIPLIQSQRKTPYSDDKKWWTPNDNSTFCEVPKNEHTLFEELILQPFFNINLQTLENLYNDKIQELKMKETLQSHMERLKHSKNLVFTGAPGTGKTYLAKQIADEFTKENIMHSTKEVAKESITNPITLIEKYYATNSDFFQEEGNRCETLRQEFLKLFPLDTIESITLDKYCLGLNSNPDNFCRWIEEKLKPLGSFFPSARGSSVYVIYKPQDENKGKYIIKKPLTMEKPETVIHLIGKAIKEIGETGKYTGELRFNRDIIMKIANSYNPDFYFPVYSKDHMETICKKFGIEINKDPYELSKNINRFFTRHFPKLSSLIIMAIIYELFIDGVEKQFIQNNKPNFNNDIYNEDIELDTSTNAEYVEFVQFHPSYDYTDFVEGLRPVQKDGKEIGFELKNGSFKKICIEAKNFPSNKYVFIIDEINRAEISKVFGELFFSIDPGYRVKNDPTNRDKIVKVKLQYSNLYTEGDDFYDGFYVPENVYIIATMNEIDRSVEPFDFAMKRRFTWYEITPEDTYDNMWKNQPWYEITPENTYDMWKNQPWYDDAQPMNNNKAYNRMMALNNAITEKLDFSSAYHIGPAYFLKLNNFDSTNSLDKKFEDLWKYHLKPVLQDYVKGFSDSAKKFQVLKDAYDLKILYKKNSDSSNE